jgi:hypothetical protein
MDAQRFHCAMEQDRNHVMEDGNRLIAKTTEQLRLGSIDGLFTREQQATLQARLEGYKGMLAGMEAVYIKYLALVQEIGDKDAQQPWRVADPALTPLDYLHRYWRLVSPADRLRFLCEMLTPNERRAIQLGLEDAAEEKEEA